MLTAISRYGARVIPNTQQLIADLRRRGQLVRGPHIHEFEDAFARRLKVSHAITSSYGRMAFYYVLKALNFPAGSEVILPALTFWVVPEMVRVAGLTPVFADVDPTSGTLAPEAFERAAGDRTVAVVPTHLWGLPCDMTPIMRIADRRGITVIEDCAHALGASYRGRPVGTFGTAGFFSFQTLKPLNTYGGGMAVTDDDGLGERVRTLACGEDWPTEKEILRKLLEGRVQRIATRPGVFTWTLFPLVWATARLGFDANVYLWEKIRPLDPLPAPYRRRYANIQAAIGLEGLTHLEEWNEATRGHAARMNRVLRGLPGVVLPEVPQDRTHVFYQYCAQVSDREAVVRRCIRRGIDIETLHVDVCTRLSLFGPPVAFPGADRCANAVQLPVYESLSGAEAERVARVARDAVTGGGTARKSGFEVTGR